MVADFEEDKIRGGVKSSGDSPNMENCYTNIAGILRKQHVLCFYQIYQQTVRLAFKESYISCETEQKLEYA